MSTPLASVPPGLEAALRDIECLFVDTVRDAPFVEQVLQPTLNAYEREQHFQYTSAARRHGRNWRTQSADCWRFAPDGVSTADDGALLVFYQWSLASGRARVVEMARDDYRRLLGECTAAAYRRSIALPHALGRLVAAYDLGHLVCTPVVAATVRSECASFQESVLFDVDLIAGYTALLNGAVPRAALEEARADRSAADETLDDALLRAQRRVLAGAATTTRDDETLDDALLRAQRRVLERTDGAISQAAPVPPSERPVEVARPDVHEFSDRLFADSAPASRRAPHPRLVRRTRLVLGAADALLTEWCAHRPDLRRSVDLFYLVEIATLQLRAGALEPLCATALRAIEIVCAQRLAFQPSAVRPCAATPAEIAALVRAVLMPRTERVAALVDRLYGEHALHYLFDAFQKSPETIDERRCASRIVVAQRVTREQLDEFIDANALLGARATLDSAERRGARLSVILGFPLLPATPLDLVTSVRTFVPEAADGVDYLVVWTAASHARRAARRRRPHREPLEMFLCITLAVWRVLALGVVPRRIAEQRVACTLRHHCLLAAPFLNAALDDRDATVVAHALAGVQALTNRAPLGGLVSADAAAAWRPTARDAPNCVCSLDAVVAALADAPLQVESRGTIARRLAEPLVEMQRLGGAARPAEAASECAIAAVYAATVSDALSLSVSFAGTAAIADAPAIGDELREFVALQRALALPGHEARQAIAALAAQQSACIERASDDAPPVACLCGAPAQRCAVMRAELARRLVPPATDAERIALRDAERMLCCICTRRWCRKRRRDRHAAETPCQWCSERGAFVTYSPLTERAVLYAAARSDNRFSGHGVLRELARARCLPALYALRPVHDGRLVPLVLPFNPAARRGERQAQQRVSHASGQLTSVAATAALFANAPPLPPRDAPRFDALLALEMLALVDHVDLSAPGGEALLAPFTAAEHAAAADVATSADAALAWALFPLASSVLVETGNVGAPTLTPTDRGTVPLDSLGSRAARWCAGGRMPAPLAGVAPLFATLVFANFHSADVV